MHDKPEVNLQALTVEEAAHIFTQAAGVQISPTTINEALAGGAPLNGDGTINALDFVAWLVRERHGKA